MLQTSLNVIKRSIRGDGHVTSQLLFLDLPTALHRLAACLLGIALAWGGLAAALASWGPTAKWARAMTPRALRVALFTAVWSTLAISPARAASDLDGLPLPSRGTTVQPTGSTADRHVVASGESLWAISDQTLATDAAPSAIAQASAAWYRRNREVIGPNPNLIHPGQVLVSPDGLR
jgi:nucleoid-associated protein YgaU